MTNLDSLLTCRVARLECQRIDEEVEEDGVTPGCGGVRAGGRRKSVVRNETGIHIVKHVGPYFADIY